MRRIAWDEIILAQNALGIYNKIQYILSYTAGDRKGRRRVISRECICCGGMEYDMPLLFTPGVGMTAVWLVLMVVLLIVEGAAPGLVSIWFALGALAAMISAILHAPIWLQVLWFLLVSGLTLWLTRPLAKKYINDRSQPTNADMLIGKECVVTEDIDNLQGTGAVSAGGREWTARTDNPNARFAKGQVVTAIRIEGVKLIVK